MDRLLIGIAGGSGSGKSTLLRQLEQQFRNEVSVLSLDNYYKSNTNLSLEERKALNYDQPGAFDMELLRQHLQMLKEEKSVEGPLYDFSRYARRPETVLIQPKRVVLVEGSLLFTARKVREALDIRIYVDTDADVRALRRVRRDVQERERTLEEAIHQYLNVVKPMHEEFVEPTKHFADLVVLEGGEKQVAMDVLVAKIRSHLNHLYME